MIPSKTEEVKAYTSVLKDKEPLTIKQLLLDVIRPQVWQGSSIVGYILSRDKGGDKDDNSNDNGINDGTGMIQG